MGSLIVNWAVARLKEKGTWVHALNLILTLSGIAIKPELAADIATAGAGLGTIIGFIVQEKGKVTVPAAPKAE